MYVSYLLIHSYLAGFWTLIKAYFIADSLSEDGSKADMFRAESITHVDQPARPKPMLHSLLGVLLHLAFSCYSIPCNEHNS